MNLSGNDSSAPTFLLKKGTRSKDLTSGRQKGQPVRSTEGLRKWDKKASNFGKKQTHWSRNYVVEPDKYVLYK